MEKITTGAVQTAHVEVSNLHDETRQYDIKATVYYSKKDEPFGLNTTGQISSGVVNIDGSTKATFSQSKNLSVNYLTDDTERQQAILMAVQDFCSNAVTFAKEVVFSVSTPTK